MGTIQRTVVVCLSGCYLLVLQGTVSAQKQGVAHETNKVANRLEGPWSVEPTLTKRLTGTATAAYATLKFVADPDVAAKVPARLRESLKQRGMTLDVAVAGYLETRGGKHPFIQTTIEGKAVVIYFRERGGDPFGDSESFNVMFAAAKDRQNDLLFVGGDFVDEPFRAYVRADAGK